MRWTWFDETNGECWSETFASPEEAVAAMAERQNLDAKDIPNQMARIRLFITSVRVTVEPVMVLRPHGVQEVDRG